MVLFFTLDFYGTCVVSELNARTHTHSHTHHSHYALDLQTIHTPHVLLDINEYQSLRRRLGGIQILCSEVITAEELQLSALALFVSVRSRFKGPVRLLYRTGWAAAH
jgi:hypothetical protein